MTREELSCIIQTYKTKQQNKNKTPEDPVEYLIIEINKNRKGELTMKKFECEPCGYIYDPAVGVRTEVSLLELLLKISRMTGYVRFVD